MSPNINLLKSIVLSTCVVLSIAAPFSIEGKKVRQSLKIDSKNSAKKSNKEKNNEAQEKRIWVNGRDTLFLSSDKTGFILTESIRFTGYDKNVGSSKETFHVVNGSHQDLTGMTIELTYKDMQGRMLHSRKLTVKCEIPKEETRKIDISSWDTQKSFYYFLSNEPQKVASPYQVEIRLLAFTIKLLNDL